MQRVKSLVDWLLGHLRRHCEVRSFLMNSVLGPACPGPFGDESSLRWAVLFRFWSKITILNTCHCCQCPRGPRDGGGPRTDRGPESDCPDREYFHNSDVIYCFCCAFDIEPFMLWCLLCLSENPPPKILEWWGPFYDAAELFENLKFWKIEIFFRDFTETPKYDKKEKSRRPIYHKYGIKINDLTNLNKD